MASNSPATPARKPKNKGMISPKSTNFQVPPASKENAPDPLSSFIAQNQGNELPVVQPPVPAEPPKAPEPTPAPAPATFVRHEQNGRKEYAPDTIGAKIWETADKLQAITPNTPVTAAAVRLALPQVAKASVTAGLSHWRKYHGKLRMKGVPPSAAAPAVAPTPAPAPDAPKGAEATPNA